MVVKQTTSFRALKLTVRENVCSGESISGFQYLFLWIELLIIFQSAAKFIDWSFSTELTIGYTKFWFENPECLSICPSFNNFSRFILSFGDEWQLFVLSDDVV